jgi:hypothetical protein
MNLHHTGILKSDNLLEEYKIVYKNKTKFLTVPTILV